MTIADVDTMYWCVIRPKGSSVPRQQESPEDGCGRRLTSETASAVYSLTIPRIAVPADGHRDPVRQLKTVRRPPIYPNGAQAISPAAPSPPFRCPHAVHRWIRVKGPAAPRGTHRYPAWRRRHRPENTGALPSARGGPRLAPVRPATCARYVRCPHGAWPPRSPRTG